MVLSQQGWIALDLGGVLFDVDLAEYSHQAQQAFAVTEQDLSAATFDSGHWQAAEIGELNAETFAQAVLSAMDIVPVQESCQRWQQCWSSVLQLRPAVIELIAEIKNPIAIWSNTDPVHAIYLRKALAKINAKWLLSCELGFEKPDPNFYQRCLQKMKVQGSLVHFFDDRQDNVSAAQKLGIQAQQVHSLEQVRSHLSQLGLLK